LKKYSPLAFVHDAEPLAQRRGSCALHYFVRGSDIVRQMLSIWRMSRAVGANRMKGEGVLKRLPRWGVSGGTNP
jgi:hypothetical protein